MEFTPVEGAPWTGNFERGATSFDFVGHQPGSGYVIVIAGGSGYVVDPETRLCIRTFGTAIDGVWELEDGSLLTSNGLWLELLDGSGIRWQTRCISWDGFRSIRIQSGRVTGEAWNPVDDTWDPFAVSLETGEAEGGSRPPDGLELW